MRRQWCQARCAQAIITFQVITVLGSSYLFVWYALPILWSVKSLVAMASGRRRHLRVALRGGVGGERSLSTKLISVWFYETLRML